MNIDNLQNIVEYMSHDEWDDEVLPIIVRKHAEILKQVGDSDKDDERNRGFLRGLEWVLDMKPRLRRELNQALHIQEGGI